MRTMFFSQTKDIPYALGCSFIGVFPSAFGLVFSDRPGQGGSFAFQAGLPRVSCLPRLDQMSANLCPRWIS